MKVSKFIWYIKVQDIIRMHFSIVPAKIEIGKKEYSWTYWNFGQLLMIFCKLPTVRRKFNILKNLCLICIKIVVNHNICQVSPLQSITIIFLLSKMENKSTQKLLCYLINPKKNSIKLASISRLYQFA